MGVKVNVDAEKESLLTCCPRFIAKQEQETPNWNRKTMKRITMYWEQEVKETTVQQRKKEKDGNCNTSTTTHPHSIQITDDTT